ncbi:MAG: hypothetical protein GQ538_11220, partial [Xanthomonadales bacterium]|nr:hypothetical protein [Xanthomonadales bacterium]
WFADIASAIEDNDDATLVHLSIGGNDFLGTWNNTFSSAEEDQLIEEIIANTTAIVDHILAQRPGLRIFWSSYDFPRPLPSGTPEQVNMASQRFSVQAQVLADEKGEALTFGDFNGLTQVVYGFDGVQETIYDPAMPIPPGDPSLPDTKYPSPAPAYADLIHLTAEAYLVLADRQYEQFYASALGESLFQINAGLNDAWYDPVTDGQGFFITVFPDLGKVSLAWFTYDTELPPEDAKANLGDAGHRWLTALGDFADDRVVLDLYNTFGGLFDSSQAVTTEAYGTIVLTFSDCNAGTVEYDIPSIDSKGVIEIQRVAGDNISLCEALNQAR